METEDIVFVVFLVIIVIVGIIIIYRFVRTRPVNAPCSSTSQCNKGLVCDTSLQVCKVPIGNTCRGNGDCTSGAICSQGACVTRPSSSSLPIVTVTPATSSPITTTFIDQSDCTTTEEDSVSDEESHYSSKSLSIKKYDERSKSFCDDDNDFMDIIHHKGSILKLYIGGILSTECEQSLSRARPNIEIVESFNNNLYGIANGKLYCTTSVRTVEWKEVQILGRVTHISTTGDKKYLWVQAGGNGMLYDREFTICNKEKISLIRNYGYDINNYVDCDTKNGQSYYEDDAYELYYSRFDSEGIVGLDKKLWKEYRNFRVLEDHEIVFIKR